MRASIRESYAANRCRRLVYYLQRYAWITAYPEVTPKRV